MAFSRDWLSALGLEKEKIDAIIQEHTSVTDALKAQRDKAKEDLATLQKEADKVAGLQKELDDLKKEDYKSKFEQEHQAFEDYKSNISKQEEAKKVEAAFRKLLADEQIKADRHDFIVSHTNLTTVTLDKDGNLSNAEDLKKEINDKVNGWGAFKVTTKDKKQTVDTPPKDETTGSGISRAKELAQKFAEERYGVKENAGKE